MPDSDVSETTSSFPNTTPIVAPLLQRWRYSYWLGTFAADAHRILLGRQTPAIFAPHAASKSFSNNFDERAVLKRMFGAVFVRALVSFLR